MRNKIVPTIALRETVRQCEYLINHLGVFLQSGNDFEVFKFFASDSERETPLDPIFSPTDSNIETVCGKWLIGRNQKGEVVQTQAMRMLDLKGQTLARFFQNDLFQIRPFGQQIDPDKTVWRLSGSAAKMQGEVCYHGGLWIRKDFRGGSLTALITRYLLAKTLLELSPDFFIGLQAPVTACRGLSAREGYTRLEQSSIIWHLTDSPDAFEDWLVWMSADEAAFNLEVPPEKFFEMFEKSAIPNRAAG
ncbi:MAG: hypothetical protein AAFN43_02360 [Pseudomonadota bacterium]